MLGRASQSEAKLDLRSTRSITALTCGIEHCSADSCKFHTWLQALLQEILISTGSANIPANQPSHKRLACHVTLLKQLLQAGIFGPLQVKAEQQEHQSITTSESMHACMFKAVFKLLSLS